MAKGFMVFVEGGNIPTVVHKEFGGAQFEAIRLSKKFPDRDVLLLEWHRRYRDGKRHTSPVEVVKAHPMVLAAAKQRQQPKG